MFFVLRNFYHTDNFMYGKFDSLDALYAGVIHDKALGVSFYDCAIYVCIGSSFLDCNIENIILVCFDKFYGVTV